MFASMINMCHWNTGQNHRRTDVAFLVLALCLCHVGLSEQSDFLDTVSKQFFGFLSGDSKSGNDQNHHNTQDGFAHMFGSLTGQQTQHQPRTHPPPHRHPSASNQRPAHGSVYRQGYYPPPPAGHHYHPATTSYTHGHPEVQSVYAHGQQQGFGQSGYSSNETNTTQPRGHYNLPEAHYASHVPHHNEQVHYAPAPVAHHHHGPPVVTEYHHHPVPPGEYHHLPPPAAEYHQEEVPVVELHHAPPPAEYHHYPEHHYHHTTHKPKRFHVSYNEPSPDLRIIDKHIRLPPVKFRFHVNPKITITTNTKDPLEKKEKDHHHHDIEPYPPPDIYSDHEAPPSYNSHKTEHYYPVEHYPVEHYPADHYPVDHYPVAHHGHQYIEPAYDLTHVNPHRSSGHHSHSHSHYEPTFKIKTRPIIFTEPPPTRRTTTTTTARPTTSTTARTTTTTTTTRRPRSSGRSSLQARNPGFSVSFTQKDSSSTATSIQRSVTVSPSSESSSTSRTSLFGSSGRERETAIERKDSNIPTASPTSSTSTTTVSSTTTRTTPSTTTTTTTTQPSTTKTTTTPSTTTTTTTLPTTTTTMTTTTTTAATTSSTVRTSAVTTSAFPKTTSTASPTSAKGSTVMSTSSIPAELTTVRTTTMNSNANEIDMNKPTANPRRRLEPLTAETVLENSESVKVIETSMLIDGKNQTVRFYYITQPVKLPLDVFNQMTGQKVGSSSQNMVRLGSRKFRQNENVNPTGLFSPP